MSLCCVRWALGIVVALALVAAPAAYHSHTETKLRNFRVVRPGVLYRSGQLSPGGLEQVIRDHRIKSVVTFRAAREHGQPHPDAWEADYCDRLGLRYYRLAPKPWHGPDGTVPADENARKFLEIMRDPANHPVLVHCYAGKHRTGAFCCVYRMGVEGWDNGRAIREMVQSGYDLYEMHEDIRHYLTTYRPAEDGGPVGLEVGDPHDHP